MDLNLQGLCKVFLALSITDKFPIPAVLNTESGELGAEQSEEISHPEITPQKEDHEVISDQGESPHKEDHEDIINPGESQKDQDFVLLLFVLGSRFLGFVLLW